MEAISPNADQYGMDAKEFIRAKQTLRERLKVLEEELNRFLANDYGIELTDKAAYANWVKSHQPFHWFVEFFGIIQEGGFQVIIGNPPWREYAAVKKDYTVKNYR